jgi:CDP-diacylglycerol--serine O-phosphatidyltransferase
MKKNTIPFVPYTRFCIFLNNNKLITRHIPNFLTCCNLLCGCLGIIQVFNGSAENAAYLIWIGAAFDYIDGFAARALKVKSEIGKQLDSFSDLITFGLLPSVMLFFILKDSTDISYLPYIAFLIPVFSALRLAKFNLDDKQTENFIGLTTTATGLFISSVPFILKNNRLNMGALFSQPAFLSLLIVVLSGLLVSKFELFGLKIKKGKFSDYALQYLFIILSVILLLIFFESAIPLILILYFTLSLIKKYSR